MKKITLFTLLASLLLCTAGCSESNGANDNPDNTEQPDNTPNEGNNNNNSSSTISNAAKQFVGYWTDNNTISDKTVIIYDFLFAPDGTCQYGEFINTNNGSGYYKFYPTNRYWTYNEQTNLLATTMNSFQWDVTIVTPNEWAGILKLSEPKATSFVRMPTYKTAKFALGGKWATKSNRNGVADTITINNIYDEDNRTLVLNAYTTGNKSPKERWNFNDTDNNPLDNTFSCVVEPYSPRYEDFYWSDIVLNFTIYPTDNFYINEFDIKYPWQDIVVKFVRIE